MMALGSLDHDGVGTSTAIYDPVTVPGVSTAGDVRGSMSGWGRELRSNPADVRMARVAAGSSLGCPGSSTESLRKSQMFKRIVVGYDGTAEGHDAVVLGAAIASATGAGLSLVGVFPPALVPMPAAFSRVSLRTRAEAALRQVRNTVAPDALIETVVDLSMPRALRHFAERWHADLVVLGSERTVREGHARIARRGRQLLYDAPYAVAVASRGLGEQALKLGRIGVGYDAGPEAHAALELAAELARGAHAALAVRSVVEDRIPVLNARQWLAFEDWSPDHRWEDERQAAQAAAEEAALPLGVPVEVSATVGDPGCQLRELSESVDVLVVGSRRWGLFARLVMGSVGETLVRDAACSLVIVPRPTEAQAAASGSRTAEGATT
jgi:nucleotide-binding universal stress UspA family protein